jgi:hypothetical protein
MRGYRFAIMVCVYLGLTCGDAQAQVPPPAPLQRPLVVPNPGVRAIRPRVVVRRPYRRPHRRRRPPMMNVAPIPRVPF